MTEDREHDVAEAGANTTAIVRYLDNDGVALAFESRGIGPRHVLFAHGWLSSRRMFYDVVERLDGRQFTSHLLDFRGSGRSDRPPSGHDVAGYASDLRRALAAIEHPVELVAHSMGAKIAQYVALDPPPNLARLTLVAPGSARAYPHSDRQRALLAATFGSRVRLARYLRLAMVREISPEAMERLVDDALVTQSEACFGWYDRGRYEDFHDRLGSIRLPTLVVAGKHDPLALPGRVRRDVAGSIAGATYLVLRNVGHNIAVEVPDELAQLVRLGGAASPPPGLA